MGKGGGSSTTNTTPWSGQQPFLTYGFDKAQDIFESDNPSYYPGATLAPLSGTTQLAQGLQTQRALGGNAAQGAGQNMLVNTLNGGYMNSNPYLDANFNAGAGAITKAYNNAVNGQTSGFAGGNRMGSGMQAFYKDQENDTLAKNLNNLYAQTYGANYDMERANQMSAAGQALGYANQDYTDLSALSDVGAAKDTYAQNLINADIDKWNYNQNLSQNKLADYMGIIQGNYGGTSTQTQKAGSNPLGNILSIASLGASIFSDIRLKKDVKKIGATRKGLGIYSYKYIGEDKVNVGHMAHEVEAMIPDAVSIHASGYKMVNYPMVEAFHV